MTDPGARWCTCGHTLEAHDGPCLPIYCECRTFTPREDQK